MEKGNVDMELIRRYIRGELTPREMYALERQAQADPMLMDIIVGMEQETLDVHGDNLADIRKRIAGRAGQRQTVIRRLAPAQRWAIAASLLAVLTVGTWWFVREDTVEQHEATVATTSKRVSKAPEAPAEPSPEPEAPAAKEREVDTTPQATARIASAEAEVMEYVEKKEERLAMATPKADTGAEKSTLNAAAARLAAAAIDSPVVVVNEQALASRKDGINNRPAAAQAAIPDKAISEKQGGPMPTDGWDAYRKYLKDAVKPAQGQKGTVDLIFAIDDDGRPIDIEVTQTTNKDLNTFAILVVRDGPRWLTGASGKRKVALQVKF